MTNSYGNFPLTTYAITTSLLTVQMKHLQHCPAATVEDHEVGLDRPPTAIVPGARSHTGIAGVQDRMAKLGGVLTGEDRGRRGTRLTPAIPMQFSPAALQKGAPA